MTNYNSKSSSACISSETIDRTQEMAQAENGAKDVLKSGDTL
jgi:hypothetical protein